MPSGKRSLTGANDQLGSGEIRLTDFQMNDVMTGGLKFVGTSQQGHHMKGFDGATAPAVELSHGVFLQGCEARILAGLLQAAASARSPATLATQSHADFVHTPNQAETTGSSAPRFDLVSSPACSRRAGQMTGNGITCAMDSKE